jgi:hypothetical protein
MTERTANIPDDHIRAYVRRLLEQATARISAAHPELPDDELARLAAAEVADEVGTRTTAAKVGTMDGLAAIAAEFTARRVAVHTRRAALLAKIAKRLRERYSEDALALRTRDE